MSLDLSIVIPCGKRPDLLARCLASIRSHLPPSSEILVIDDGSADAQASRAAERFGARAVRLRRSRGFCVAANVGLSEARAPIVELLNDDTRVTAGWAEAALGQFQDARVGAVAPLVLLSAGRTRRPPRIDSAGDEYFLGGVTRKRGHGAVLPTELDGRRVFGASASSAFYRREAVARVGAFPECFGAYFEDVDLSFRLNRAGYVVRFEPRSRVLHDGSASYGRGSRRLLELQSRNEERVFWRNLPSATLAGALPGHLAILAAKAWRRWEEGALAPFLCGRLRLLGEVRALRRQRRQLQERFPLESLDGWPVERRYTPITL